MTKKRRLSKILLRLPLAVAVGASAIALHACGRAEAEPQADPVQVQAYLDRVDAEEKLISGQGTSKPAQAKAIRNLVEGAAVRAPSEAAINRIESAVAR